MTTGGDRVERGAARLVTLSFLCSGGEVLLLRHPDDNDRFAGCWNGIGGHVEPGECIHAAARRELREEAGLDVPELELRGVVHESDLLGQAHVLFVFVGEVRERSARSPEGLELAWHPIREIGSLRLVHDVATLLSRALAAQRPFFAVEHYDGADRPAPPHPVAGADAHV
jgi:8-oxo-dGTP diphosphatase